MVVGGCFIGSFKDTNIIEAILHYFIDDWISFWSR